jgi:hypothetical protein
MAIKPEQLGYWYFRLNGFLTTANFVVHPRFGDAQGTDIDVLGVRFPYRQELVVDPLQDADIFRSDTPQIVLAEIKTGRCALNGPWTTPVRQNMENALMAVGAIPQVDVEAVAHDLYSTGESRARELWFRLVCVGAEPDADIATRYPAVPQILWSEVEDFIYTRFKENVRRKIAHPQWDSAGQFLWDAAMRAGDLEAFRSRIYRP